MIYATDRAEDFVTYWHLPPPPKGVPFAVTMDEWGYAGRTVRHVHAWCFTDIPHPDSQGWIAVPYWYRNVMT